MVYEIKIKGDIAILVLSGKRMGDKFTSNLYDEAKRLIGDGFKNIIFDLQRVQFINSIGLGIIIACRTATLNAGGNLKLIFTSGNIKKYFKITELDRFFEFYENEKEALASFPKKSQ